MPPTIRADSHHRTLFYGGPSGRGAILGVIRRGKRRLPAVSAGSPNRACANNVTFSSLARSRPKRSCSQALACAVRMYRGTFVHASDESLIACVSFAAGFELSFALTNLVSALDTGTEGGPSSKVVGTKAVPYKHGRAVGWRQRPFQIESCEGTSTGWGCWR
jgi:hypothetical protein